MNNSLGTVLAQISHFLKADPETSTGGWSDGEACDPYHRIDLSLLESWQAAILQAANRDTPSEAVAWEVASPKGERPALAFLTSKRPTMENFEEQGWTVTPLYLGAPKEPK